jgi:malate dehydrogenase (oxaloacetate-decarboxylating)(NADP+)
LAGLYSATRLVGGRLADQRLLFLGAGSAATGIADLTVGAMVREGLTMDAARSRCWFVDSRGLVVKERDDLAPHKRPYAHPHRPIGSLVEAVRELRPTALLGVSAQGGAFTPEVIAAMANANDRPIIFALSNPTSKAECTAESAYRETNGRAIFASGSPFDPVEVAGHRLEPGQGNNAYIFPGLGLGVLVSGARRVTDEMFQVAARVLADLVSSADLAVGRLYPRLTEIRHVSEAIAVVVAEQAWESGWASRSRPTDLGAEVRATMWEPRYQDLSAVRHPKERS